MNFSLDFFLLLFLLGAIHGLINVGILHFQKSKSESRLMFSLYLLTTSLACLKTVIQESSPSFWLNTSIPLLFQFSWGPLLLLYTQSSLHKGFRLQKKQLLLFIPSAIFDFLFKLISDNTNIDNQVVSDISFLIDFLAGIHFTYYILGSIKLLRQYKNGLKGFYSNISTTTVNWLYSLYIVCSGMLAGWLFYIISTMWLWSYSLPFMGMKTYYPVYLWFSGSIYFLIYKWHQSTSIQKIEKPVKPKISSKPPIYDSNMVLEKVQQNNYYRDPKLTIKQLASQLELNINDLSQTINVGLGKSFNDFINDLRVEELKRKMQDPKLFHLTQLGLALESGFNSKATFNRAFKKSEGISPSEYKKNLTKKKSQMVI